MTYICVFISTLLLACFEEAAFILCNSQPKMLQQVFLMLFHFLGTVGSTIPQSYPQSHLHASCSASVPILHWHSSWGQFGERSNPGFLLWCSGSCRCVKELPPLSCACKHTQAAVCATAWLQWTPDCDTELRPQPLISALQNMSLGRWCYKVARLYQKWKSASLNRFCCFACSLNYSFRVIYHHFSIASN